SGEGLQPISGLLKVSAQLAGPSIAVFLVHQLSDVHAIDRNTSARDYLHRFIVGELAERVLAKGDQYDRSVTRDFLQPGVLLFAFILFEKLNRFSAKQHKGERVVDVCLAEIQRVSVGRDHCLVQSLRIAGEVLNDLYPHAVSDQRNVILRLNKAPGENGGGLKYLLCN